MLRHRTNAALLPSVFLLIALWICLEALQVPFGSFRMPGAGFFPLLLGLSLGLLALGLLITNLLGDTAAVMRLDSSRREIFSLIAAMFMSVWLFERAGYLLTMSLFLGIMMKVLRRTSWMIAVTVALLGSITSYVVFGHLLKIALPAGMLPF